MPGVGMEPPPPPSQGEPQFGPGRSDFANGPPQSNFQPEPLDQPPPPPSQGGPQFEPGRSDFTNGPPQSNFQPEPPGKLTNFRPQQGAPMQADFGGGSPFDNQNRPPPDYGNMGDYDGDDGAGPAGPLSRYLSPLRRFFNPITRHHFVHSDPVVMMRNIGGTGAPTHFIIPVPTYNRNQEVIDQLCPFLVRLHSMKMGGAQLLVLESIPTSTWENDGMARQRSSGNVFKSQRRLWS
ncbi:unnamed protein product, partial [Mesorhabditis belari]|uniref:Uncharacterized protein n=1 Tax=Mesorhabditis belari TaxID=2138241 RepID=A0AAF3FDT0_9BILA